MFFRPDLNLIFRITNVLCLVPSFLLLNQGYTTITERERCHFSCCSVDGAMMHTIFSQSTPIFRYYSSQMGSNDETTPNIRRKYCLTS